MCETIKFMAWLPKWKILKCLSKNNAALLKKSIADIIHQSEQQSNKEIIDFLQE